MTDYGPPLTDAERSAWAARRKRLRTAIAVAAAIFVLGVLLYARQGYGPAPLFLLVTGTAVGWIATWRYLRCPRCDRRLRAKDGCTYCRIVL